MRKMGIRPWNLVTVLCLVYSLAAILVRGGDPLMLVTIGARFNPDAGDHAYSEEGYDGQFVYSIARDPDNAAPTIDVPAYRFQRILLPAAGRVLGLGQAGIIPWTLLLVNLVSLASGTALLEKLLTERNLSRWYALGYGLTLGTFGAARLSLPEPLAYALILGGITLAERERWFTGAIFFALAALAKEVTLVFVAGYGLYLLAQRRWSLAIRFGALATAPFVIWQLVLFSQLGAFGVGSGGALATGFEIIPFAGVIRILIAGGLPAFVVFGTLLGPFVLVPMWWALRQCWRDYRARDWSIYTYLLFVNGIVMLFVPFSTYREPLGILRFIVGLQIGIILYAAHRHNIRVLRNSTIWVLTVFFVIVSDFAGGS